jgi:hypothetical protein
MNDKQLDDAIDRAVHEMMDVEPRAGFRQRVASRIEAPPPRLLTPWRLATLGAAAAVVVLVVAISFRPSDTVPRIASTEVAPAQPPVAQVPPAEIRPPAAESTELAAKPREVRRNVVVARSLADSEPLPSLTGVEPLVPPATLTVRQLETHAPEIQDIVLAPIAISELSVDPLDRSLR